MKRIVYPGIVRVSPTAAAHVDRVDHADCWQTPLLPGDSRDPQVWAEASFGGGTGWAEALMKVRNVLVRPFGLKGEPAETTGAVRFPVLATSDNEVLMGLQDRHLDFWVTERIDDGVVSCTTYVKINGRFGQTYWSVVRLVHPFIVRSMFKKLGPVTD